MRRRVNLPVIAVTIVTLLAACGGGDKGIKVGEKHEVGDESTFAITAADQTSNGKAVRVPEVHSTSKGYIAVHLDAQGAAGPVIGVSELLDAGENKNVRIKLDKPLEDDADVWPMLHLEDNGNTTYDFPNGDDPAKVDNKVVTIKVNVTVR